MAKAPPKPFLITPHDGSDKEFNIVCTAPAGGIYIIVDYDDVDHKATDRLARKIVRILNEHWNDSPKPRKAKAASFDATRTLLSQICNHPSSCHCLGLGPVL